VRGSQPAPEAHPPPAGVHQPEAALCGRGPFRGPGRGGGASPVVVELGREGAERGVVPGQFQRSQAPVELTAWMGSIEGFVALLCGVLA